MMWVWGVGFAYFDSFCSQKIVRRNWLGMRDSNPRMPGPEPGALPLGESPSCDHYITKFWENLELFRIREWFAVYDGLDISFGDIDGGLVWKHDIERLLTHGIGVFASIMTVEAIFGNLPAWHVLKLKADESGDFVLAEIGFKTARNVAEDFGIFSQNDGGMADFFDDGAEDVLLVLDAVTIASGIGFALAGEGESGGAVHMDITFWNSNTAVSPRRETLVRIDLDAANSVDEIDDGGEVDFDIIINRNIKEIGDGV